MINLQNMLSYFSETIFQKNSSNYIELETASLNSNAYVAKDGSYMSLIRVDGMQKIHGPAEAKKTGTILRQLFSVMFKNRGHTLQSGFDYNPEFALKQISASTQKAITAAQNIGLDLTSMLSERCHHLAKFISVESNYVALWTHPSVLNRSERKRINAKRKKDAKDNPRPSTVDAQNLYVEYPEILDRHKSIVETFVNKLKDAGIKSEALSSHEMGSVLRKKVDSDFTSETWKPILPGDKIPIRIGQKIREQNDLSSIAYPPLYSQLMPRDATRLDARVVKLGGCLYSPIYIDIMPQDVQPFSRLLGSMIREDMPWRILTQLSSEGMQAVSGKAMLSAYTAFASDTNKKINVGIKHMRNRIMNNETEVVVRICLTSWVKGDDTPENRELLESRTSKLATVVSMWGQCEVDEVTGDPYEGFLSTLTGLTSKNIGNPTVGPINEVIDMLPFYRPTSPWKTGAVPLRTQEGKLFPFQPASSLQTTWVNLYAAPPGYGKSVLANMMNMALTLAAGNKNLPFIHIVDIGPSSSGFISLLKNALPDHQKHFVQHIRYKMDKDYATNPLDTQPGLRKPLPIEKDFMRNFILSLLTPAGKSAPYDGMAGLVGQVVDEAFTYYSDSQSPKAYLPRVETKVDEAILNASIITDEASTWFEIEDALMDAGYIHEATLAHRRAVPLLSDLVTISRRPQVMDVYGTTFTESTRENIIDAFTRLLSEALRAYPVISEVTRFDLGEARIVSVDLDEVAKGSGVEAVKQTGIMYLLARNLARNFFLNENDVPHFPERYREYQANRIREYQETIKHLHFDEFHRTGSKNEGSSSNATQVQAIVNQVEIDIREGRKWNLMISLISQSLQDFTEQMAEYATGIFVLGLGNNASTDFIKKTYGLNDVEINRMMMSLNGPSSAGTNVFAYFKTKKGIFSQILTVTIGPEELWAYSTTREDSSIRNLLYQVIGHANARRVLARRFPGGSAKAEVERRLEEVSGINEGAGTEDEVKGNIIDVIVKELVDSYNKQMLEAA